MRRLVMTPIVMIIATACSSSSSGPSSVPTTATPSHPSATSQLTPTTRPRGTSAAPPLGAHHTATEIGHIRLQLSTIASKLDSPVAAAARPHDTRLYVAEQHRARVVSIDLDRPTARTIVLDLRSAVTQGNEQGLLGLAFSLDGSKLFIDFTDPKGDTRIVEYTMRPDNTADPTTKRQLLLQRQPFPNHNGGQLVVGRDGMLYIALGDGGFAGDPFKNGQNLGALLGKILRIDPRPSGTSPYRVPGDNPFLHRPDARPEVWHWGLRNPWRFSFDRATNDLWIGDVGQDNYEEIDHVGAGVRGENFGWNRREGTHGYKGGQRPANAVEPVLDYPHDSGRCSVTGGYVYRGTRSPQLQGIYIFTDFCEGDLEGIDATNEDAHPANGSLHLHVDQPTSFAQDNNGELYVLSQAGTIQRIDAG